MGEPKMELGERELEKIGEYVKTHLPQWLGETGAADAPSTKEESAVALHKRELDILERVVRVEDELKNLREVMEERFGKMNERFEAQQNLIEERFHTVNERFNKMDERFEAQQNLIEERFHTVNERFSKMDERFEAQRELMDERFDHLEKRTAFVQWVTGIGFTAIGILIVVLNYLG